MASIVWVAIVIAIVAIVISIVVLVYVINAQGILGPASLDVIEVRDRVVSTGNFAAASATCPPDRILVGGGGGFFTNGVIVSFITLPDELVPNTWNATAIGGVFGTSTEATSVAMCAKLVP